MSTSAYAISADEKQKIEYLIASIADLHDAHFIRNGTEFDSLRAADHLRSKLHYAGAQPDSVSSFGKIHTALGSARMLGSPGG